MNQVNTANIRYFSSIEWMRLLAAFGIVWFHTENAEWRSAGYAGLPIFLLVFGFLIVVHYDEISLSEFVKRRASRLLLPWFFWSIVYILARAFKTIYIDKESLDLFSSNTLLIGGSLHLWFLPFSFLLAIVFWFLCRFILKRQGTGEPPLLLICFSLLAIISFFVICDYVRMNFSLPAPFSQWLFALPSLPVAFIFGYLVRSVKSAYRLPLLILVYAVVVGVCFYTYRSWRSMSLISYGIGTILTIAAIQYPLPFEKTARKVSALTYGIYLIHPLIASLLDILFKISTPSLKIIIVFIVSTIAVYIMKRTFFRFVL